MKHRLMVALAVLAVVACRNNNPAPGFPFDAGVDGRGADVTVPIDASVDRLAAPDSTKSDASPVDGAVVDGISADVAREASRPDVTAPDVGHDTRDIRDTGVADAGVTCGPGASREMLCLTYCDGVGRFCSGENTQYRNADECRAACNAPASTWACGKPGDTTGNSVFCRLGHTALAGVGAAAMECPNAGPDSPACQ